MRRSIVSVAVIAAMLTTFLSVPAAQAAVTPPWDPYFSSPATAADIAAILPSTTSNRTFGLAAGDYDGDGKADVVVGRTDGRVYFLKGNGNGTFAAPVGFAWKLETNNAWALAAGDVNGDGRLDVVWGANAPGADTGGVARVNDGDVRYLVGNGNGTFATTNNYVRSGITFNAGTLVADIGIDTGSVALGNVDGVPGLDIVAGSIDGTNSTVKLLKNLGGGAFAPATALISQPSACATPCSPIYFPAITTQNSPWGLSIADADADGDADLWVNDRALYTYLYRNNGSGTFTLQGSNAAVAGRPNVYLGHDSFRPSVGFTGYLAAGDVNGDGRADALLGLHSGTQTPASGTAHDGEVILDVSEGTSHAGFGMLADIGTAARGVTLVDLNGDTYLDIVSGNYEGQVKVMRQLPPLDSDGDGVSDYIDNAHEHANAPRLDMNTDGITNHQDQLDNDFDTELGNPENQSSWVRLGDPADEDDDNDAVNDGSDNCPFTANAGQEDADEATDADTFGNACDPLDNRDPDGDGVPTGPLPGDPLYDETLAAKIKWGEGDTHFVIRIDALGRLFQNEFTQLMTDAAALSPDEWEAKCWENYGPVGTAAGQADPADPCGTVEGGDVTLAGGKEVPVTVVTIPRLLWTDEPVIHWINDRNDNPRFELGQHGTYHFGNVPNSDWAEENDRYYFSCEACGLTEAESYELLRIGYDTLQGNYDNMWVEQSGATAGSEKIDWSDSALPLLSYAPPFNADDAKARAAVAQLGFRATSSSVFEENSLIFTPEGSHHEQLDQYGVFHASADVELEPPETAGGTYDPVQYAAELESQTQDGGLNTWLIEEVEWSGRPCNDQDRVGPNFENVIPTCPEAGGATTNRENNTVYAPRWDGWMQLLDHVKSYPGGVVMTMGEVALAQGFDNAPTVANSGQADADNDGVGDVIDDAALTADDVTLSRNEAGTLSATLANGAAQPMSGETVEFSFDADGDAIEETLQDTTDASGVAEVTVTPTRPVGPATFDVSWDGKRATAADSGDVNIADATDLALDASNPTSGQVTDQVTVGATLEDTDDAPLAGQIVSFSIGSASGNGTTDGNGHAQATLTLAGPVGSQMLTASFAGAGLHGSSSDSTSFTVNKEDTVLALADAVATKNAPAIAQATLTQDGPALGGRTIEFFVQETIRKQTVYTSVGTAVTNASGVASKEIPGKYISKTGRPIRATFAGDADFVASTGNASAYRA